MFLLAEMLAFLQIKSDGFFLLEEKIVFLLVSTGVNVEASDGVNVVATAGLRTGFSAIRKVLGFQWCKC